MLVDPVTDGLSHFYPFRGDLEDKVGSAHAFDYTPLRAADKFEKPEKAMKFENNNTI